MPRGSGFDVRLLSSLSKVFADQDLADRSVPRASCLLGEVFSFQVAYRSATHRRGLTVQVESDLPHPPLVRSVGLAPAEFLGSAFDDNVLRTTPGLYPDPLFPIVDGVVAPPGQWRSLWFTLNVPRRATPGTRRLAVRLLEGGAVLGEVALELEIVGVVLPPQSLIHTSWFHVDCLATQYQVPVWSAAHWEWVEKYLAHAVDHGINMVLTPVFTPPLDTRVGGERPTAQLVGITRRGRGFQFDFSLLGRWVDMATRCGVQFFEISHLFTQWGAAHCPKIVVRTGRGEERLFGWEDDAAGTQYQAFLAQFLPALVAFIHERGLRRKVYFHVSDEPSLEHLESFARAAGIVREHLTEFPFIDALSSIRFYDEGLVPNPIPALDHLQPFLDRGIENLWTYYCCGQWSQVANRFFHFPSARNRILGAQLYRLGLAGFLQWGYNFWYTQGSTRAIDPYRVTDADRAFPAGDAFLVYPGPDGPVDSIRGEVFREAIQDQRALKLLESLQGRDATVALVENGLPGPLTATEYPRDPEWLLTLRRRVNRRIRTLTDPRRGR